MAIINNNNNNHNNKTTKTLEDNKCWKDIKKLEPYYTLDRL